MAFNIFNFLIGRTLAEREGIADQSSQNRLALVGGLLGSSTTGLVLTSVLARREAETIPPVSPGPVDVDVPPVTGFPFDEAEKIVTAAKLRPDTQEVLTNTVIAQNPAPPARVAPGSIVTLFVTSAGARTPARVPNLDFHGDVEKKQEFTFEQAREILQDENFKILRRDDPSSDVPKGTVIETDPLAGTQVIPGSTVQIVVSSGPSQQAAGSGPDVKAKK